MIKRLVLSAALFMGVMFTAQAAIDVYEFDTPEQEEVFHQLGKELRCPKCQNNNIADSNAGLAQDLRQKVYEMLKDGKSENEIVDYMVARYGNFVTYNPPLTASTVVLWAAPAIFVLLGFTVLVARSRKKNGVPGMLDQAEQKRLDALLNDNSESENKKDSK